jgi:hypothetical protein
VVNASVAVDGCATLQGGTKGSAPHHLRARSRPNLPSYESLYGLSTDRASQTPLWRQVQALTKFLAALVGIHWRFIVLRYRRGCPAAALPTRGLHYTAAGFLLRTVELVTSWKWEREGKLWHERPTGLALSLPIVPDAIAIADFPRLLS